MTWPVQLRFSWKICQLWLRVPSAKVLVMWTAFRKIQTLLQAFDFGQAKMFSWTWIFLNFFLTLDFFWLLHFYWVFRFCLPTLSLIWSEFFIYNFRNQMNCFQLLLNWLWHAFNQAIGSLIIIIFLHQELWELCR